MQTPGYHRRQMLATPRQGGMTAQRDALISEAQLQATVVGMAELYGWLVHYTNDSRRGRTGMPDLFLARALPGRPGVAMAMELKTEKGQLSKGRLTRTGKWLPGQVEWLELLGRCSEFRSGLYRPSDLDSIEEILR